MAHWAACQFVYLLLTANAFEVFAIFRLTRKPGFDNLLVKFGKKHIKKRIRK